MIVIWGILLAARVGFYANMIVVVVGYNWVFLWTIIFPLGESHKKRRSTPQNSTEQSSASNVLTTNISKVSQIPEKLGKFKKFLALELSIENVLFYVDVQSWKRDYEQPWNGAGQIRSKANELIDKYLNSKSAYEVNLPQMILEIESVVKNNAENLPRSLFDQAESEIKMLMQQDTFRRFEFKQSKLRAKETVQLSHVQTVIA
jgi:hypothetical protein